MTQLVPDAWNEWSTTARVSWWGGQTKLPAYMPFFEQGVKQLGGDAWIHPDSGDIWLLKESPSSPGKYRWETKPAEPLPVVYEWAERHSEEMQHEQRDSVKTLREAEQIITGDRYNDYGPPAENFGRIATYWNQYLKDNPPPLKPSDTAMLMVFVKIAREAAGHKTDSVVDAEGYLAIYEELRNKEILDEETVYGGN